MMQAVSCSGLTVYFDRNSGIRSSGTTVHFRKNKHLSLFEAELIVEILTVMVISIVNLRKKRKKYR